MSRKPYASDVSDDEWNFVAPYLTLMSEDAPQREHSLRDYERLLETLVGLHFLAFAILMLKRFIEL